MNENNEKKMKDSLRLFEGQKQMMDTLLERGAISQAQYDKSLEGLKEKMGIESVLSQYNGQ